MAAQREQEIELIRGGTAPKSLISKVLPELSQLQSREDAQAILSVLLQFATPENYKSNLPLSQQQLSLLQGADIANKSGCFRNKKVAMVTASCIHFTEGQYMVFAPIA